MAAVKIHQQVELIAGNTPTGFCSNYEKLNEKTRLRKILDNTNTIEPAMISHEGARHGRFRRHLTESEMMIVGLQQKVEDHVKFVN